jgi:class 3 adenylate cyclase
MDAPRFSRQRLAELSGFTEREVEACEEAGLLRGDESGYRGIELVKLHLIRQVAAQHGGLPVVLETLCRGGYTLDFLEAFLPRSGELVQLTLREVLAGDTWLDEVAGLIRAAGLPPLDPDAPLRASDLAAFTAAATLRQLELPIEHRAHATRVTSEALRRAAEVQVRLFREHVEGHLKSTVSDEAERYAALAALAERTVPAILEITSWLHARHLEHYVLDEVASDLEEALGPGGPRPPTASVVAFVDLCGFTALAAGAGDHDAAMVAARFEDEVVDRSRVHGGRVVKLLGDGAMLHFEKPAGAVRASLELVGELPRAGLPRCRVGAHRGPVVSHNGDLYGSTVNIAARINDYARPGEVLVSDAVVAGDPRFDDVDLEEIGEVSLKGVPLPVLLHRARLVSGAPQRLR